MAIIDIVIKEMKERGESFCYDDYHGGECISYHYSKNDKTLIETRMDTVVGSYSNEIPISEITLKNKLSGVLNEQFLEFVESYRKEMEYLLFQLKLTALHDVEIRNYVEMEDGSYLKWHRTNESFMFGDLRIITYGEAMNILMEIPLKEIQNKQDLYHSNDIISSIHFFKKGICKALKHESVSSENTYTLLYKNEVDLFELTVTDKSGTLLSNKEISLSDIKYELPKFPYDLVKKTC
jgi:hypothetical protein